MQGLEDLNPYERFWRPLCYHYIKALSIIISLTVISYQFNSPKNLELILIHAIIQTNLHFKKMSLAPQRIKEIENITLDILMDSYDAKDSIIPPIILEEVLEDLDVNLEVGEFSDPSISGYYERDKKCISVSNNDPYIRQRFTTAHELGHHVLHKLDKNIFYRQDALNITGTKELIETEANWFAASMLLPSFLVKQLWPIMQSVQGTADSFLISRTTAYYRLYNLGLISGKDNKPSLKK